MHGGAAQPFDTNAAASRDGNGIAGNFEIGRKIRVDRQGRAAARRGPYSFEDQLHFGHHAPGVAGGPEWF